VDRRGAAEQARRQIGHAVARLSWKNLVFAGGPGAGKSRAAAAVGRLYKELGVMSPGHLVEVAAADLAGATGRETGLLLREAADRAEGGILMITGADTWAALPDHGQQALRCLYDELTELRHMRPDHTAVILSGQAVPLRALLAASPPLAARFPAIIDFPGYTTAQLAAIFTTLTHEAGFSLTPAATAKAAAILAASGAGSARLAVRLLDQTAACQALRITSTPQPHDSAMLATIRATDIPAHLDLRSLPDEDRWPGQYL
jgi:stage V sporulation protein K